MRWKLGENRAWLVVLLMFVSTGMLWGCAKKAVDVGGQAVLPAEDVGATGPGGAGTGAAGGLGEEGLAGVGDAGYSEGRTSAPFSPVYFDFDRFNIREDMRARMEDNARVLLDHAGLRIEVQGNCDERGTNEYNLALGEKRANSAKAYLVNLGVAPDRLDAVSFGEERPLDPGQNEQAWAKNRRDDFVILKK